MKKAFNNNGVLQDVVMTDPFILFPSSYAALFIDVPDEAQNGWLWDGEIASPPPEPEPTPAPVPASVAPRQARIALALTPATDNAFPHLLAQIEAAFADLPEPDKTVAEITWEYSIEVQRSNQLIAQMQGMLGLTDAQIDQLFIAASQIAP